MSGLRIGRKEIVGPKAREHAAKLSAEKAAASKKD